MEQTPPSSWGTKSLIVITEDGLLPRPFAAVNRRFGTPHWLLSFIFAVSAASLVVAGNRVETFAIFASLGGIVLFLLTVAVLFVDLSSRENGWFFLGVFAVWVVQGAGYAALRLRRRKSQLMSRTSG